MLERKEQDALLPMQAVEYRAAVRVTPEGRRETELPVSEEMPLTIYLNGREIVTMLCTPQEEEELALGFVVSEGMVAAAQAVKKVLLERERGMIWLEAEAARAEIAGRYLKRCLSACCGRGRAEFYFANDVAVSKYVENELRIPAALIDFYAHALETTALTHSLTHGVHCGAVVAEGTFIAYSEDIGRHNVFDKLYGRCLKDNIPLGDKAIVFSGRISSEILLKLSKMAVPVVIARSVPTTLAIDLAEKLGITLVGAAKGRGFNVYSHRRRILE